ncbi:MAG: hypothetical protein CMP23_09370 [Rickettsiales bacterium]|nr:hypothetical protein [Rickettsiales bacterium]|tara:strand:+ start:1386 stop:2027 length:642 start_codon:yes stop_codon:yes gene_type:complete
MNAQHFTALAILPTFILGSFLSTAAAGPRDGSSSREFALERAEQSSLMTDRPTLRPEPIRSFDLDLAWFDNDVSGEFDAGILLDGELFNVQIEGEGRQGSLSIFDRRGDLLIGYVATPDSVVLFDNSGLVDRSLGEPLSTSVADYGLAASVLTDPGFVLELAEASGVVVGSGDDDEPAAYWWVAAIFIARCIDASIEFDGEGNVTGGSLGWDC